MNKFLKKLLSIPGLNFLVKKAINIKVESEANEISTHFVSYLKPQIAFTQELRDTVLNIRHNVYCEELAFEESKPDKKETDEFDKHSSFCMIEHKPTQEFAGCVRLVESNNQEELLPIEAFCSHAITDENIHPKNFKRSEICEISRLAVKAQFRRRQSDKFEGAATGVINESTYSEIELRCFPFIAIGLYMSAASLAMDRGLHNVFVMMEPRLARSMKFLGINFKQLGPAIEYHGKRAPYYINPDIFYKSLKPGFKSLYDSIEKDIYGQLAARKKEIIKNKADSQNSSIWLPN